MKPRLALFIVIIAAAIAGYAFMAKRSSKTEASNKSEGTKECFACKGMPPIKCAEPGCIGGKKDCPQPCLRLSRGVWEHMTVAGHKPTELWQKFNSADGKSYQAFTQSHVGHIIVMQNGVATDSGSCKTCNASTKVPCEVCAGTGVVPCRYCHGTKRVPASWTEISNPMIATDPAYLHLKDGRAIKGKIWSTVGEKVTIKKTDGTMMEVTRNEL